MGIREVLDRYPYLKHLIKFWPGDWEKQIAKINEAVGMNDFSQWMGEGNVYALITSKNVVVVEYISD